MVYDAFSEYYSVTGDYKNAYLQLLEHHNLSDSLLNISDFEKYSRLNKNYKFETEKQAQEFISKQNNLKQIEKTKRFTIVILLVILIMITTLIFTFYLYKSKKTISDSLSLLEIKNNDISLKNIEISEFNAKLEQANEEISATMERTEIINQELELISVAVNYSGSAVAILDKEGNFSWVNPTFTKVFGTSLDEFRSQFGKNIINKTTPDNSIQQIENCINQSEETQFEFNFQIETNKNKRIFTVLTPNLDFEKKRKKIIAVFTDISSIPS